MPTDLYTRTYTSTATGTPDPNRVFWGDTGVTGSFTLVSYISLVINGTTYWTPVYQGNKTTAECSSNLVGTYTNTGTFTSVGFVAISENNTTTKWLRLYSRA
jgi:hypothetical protein